MTELIKQKIQHLDHIEDLIVCDGARGASRALQFLTRLANADEQLLTNIKVDGSPGIVVGLIPNGEPNAGEFFVGTKSALSANGKRYTQKTANNIARENSAGLASKLTIALKYLPELGLSKVYQGDLLFTDDVYQAEIDGVLMQAFKPNTIVYAVPVGGELSKAIARARVGVVLHTVYEGDTFDSMYATHTPDFSSLQQPRNVFWKTNNVKLHKAVSEYLDAMKLIEQLEAASTVLDNIDPALFMTLKTNPKVAELILLYTNANIRKGQPLPGAKDRVEELIAYIIDRHTTETAKLKSQAGKQRAVVRNTTLVNMVKSLSDELTKVFIFAEYITNVKLTLLQCAQSLDGIDSFYQEGSTFRKTSGEGLVVACAKTNDIVKLVDRYEFSRINFQQPKNWT